jgi:trehalose-phosphatase
MLSEVQAAVQLRPPGSALLVLLDFDGTLAEFNPDPEAPELTPARHAIIDSISHHPGTFVGIVSGRRLDDLMRRTRLGPHIYHAGLHGIEIEIDGRRTAHPDLDAAAARLEGLAEALRTLQAERPGVVIEDKGASVAVHARALPTEDHERVFARADVLAVPWIAERLVRRLEGKAVVEYLPNISGHKGEATQWIVNDVSARTERPVWVIYIGDDLTDEDAFRAITSGIGVLVGLRPTAATHKLDGISGVDQFLRWLASAE